MLKLEFLEGLYTSFQNGTEPKFYLFFRNGRVYNRLPTEGRVNNFDWTSATRESPKLCGYYRIQSSQIILDWGGGRGQETAVFSQNANAIKINQFFWYRVLPWQYSYLDGRYTHFAFYNNLLGYGSSTKANASTENSIIFYNDGRFEQKHGFTLSGENHSSKGISFWSGQGEGGGKGHYQIKDYTIELIYSKGKKALHTFFVWPENIRELKPEMIAINTRMLVIENLLERYK